MNELQEEQDNAFEIGVNQFVSLGGGLHFVSKDSVHSFGLPHVFG